MTKSNQKSEETKPGEEHTAAIVPELTDAELAEISYPDMVRGLAKDGHVILAKMDGPTMHLLHMAIGMAGEAGELLEIHQKAVDSRMPEYELDREHVLEECGDFAFYLEGWEQGWEYAHGYRRFRQVPCDGAGASPDFDLAFADNTEQLITRLMVNSSLILDIGKRYGIYGKCLDDEGLYPELVRRTMLVISSFESLMRSFGFTQEDVQLANKRKLGKRYRAWKYSDDQAHARRDKDGELNA